MNRPVTYVLCELKARDFESGLLICNHLVRAGHRVVFGQLWAIGKNLIWGKAPKGAVLFRTANKVQGDIMRQCKDSGHVVLAMDEEALPFVGTTLLDNVHQRSMEVADEFLAQSLEHAAIIQGRYSGIKVTVTGNPRIEVLQRSPPAPMAGPYVLFNTSFAFTNSLWGDTEAAFIAMVKATKVDETEARIRLNFEIASRKQMLKLIGWVVQRFPVVIRPHPAENPDGWKDVQHENARIVVGESALAWIRGSTITVHSNSTTGLEAAILGTPCINVSPPDFADFTARFVMREVNRTVPDAATALDDISRFLTDRSGPLSEPPPQGYFVPDGAKKIAEALARRALTPPTSSDVPWALSPRSETQVQKFSVSLSEVGPRLPGATVSQLDNSVFLISP